MTTDGEGKKTADLVNVSRCSSSPRAILFSIPVFFILFSKVFLFSTFANLVFAHFPPGLEAFLLTVSHSFATLFDPLTRKNMVVDYPAR